MAQRVQRVEPDSSGLHGVIQLARAAKSTVGFLADAAFAQRAERGTLLTVGHPSTPDAYLLYDLPRDEVRIVHLVVAPAARGLGLARVLVEHVSTEHAQRRGIVLHCRDDYGLERLWGNLGFVPRAQRPGRSHDGKPLTRWYRSFGQPDLFSFDPDQGRRLAVLDACTFYNLVNDGPDASMDADTVAELRSDWVAEHARLGTVSELYAEIARSSDPARRQRNRAAAERFHLSGGSEDPARWHPVYVELDADPDNSAHASDLKHLAQSALAQASWLVTTDSQFRRKYGKVAREHGVDLVTPAAFLRELDEAAYGGRYRPRELSGRAVTMASVRGRQLEELVEPFVNHRADETIGDFRRRLEALGAQTRTVELLLLEIDGLPRGLVALQQQAGELQVQLIRVSRGTAVDTLARQLLASTREHAVRRRLSTVRIADAKATGPILDALADEGFLRVDGALIARPVRGRGTVEVLRSRIGPAASDAAPPSTGDDPVADAAELERRHAPYRVLKAGIPTFVLPIKELWARALFPDAFAQARLFDEDWNLGLRRDQVYYRSPMNHRGLAAPARILWYVSGAAGKGGGAIRAVSALREVSVDYARRLFLRNRNLGVYRELDVTDAADRSGKVMALRFSHTELLRKPIALADYQAQRAPEEAVVRGPEQISEHTFVELLERGAPDA